MTQSEDKIIQEIRKRFTEAEDFWTEAYQEAVDDLEFINGDQWPSGLKADREADGRPCLTINKTAVYLDQVIGDIRQNEPSIKVKPVDSGSDPDVAEILTGLIRNIEVQSGAEIAYDTAAESAAACGFGAFRVITEYSSDDGFEQDIKIKRIKNPFTILWDPLSQEWDRSDSRYCFVTERISKDEFSRRYPDATEQSAPGNWDKNHQWADDKTIRIAEYWKRDSDKTKIYLVENPETGEQETFDVVPDGWKKVNEREVEKKTISRYLTNGVEILEGPVEWPGTMFPICSLFGKEINIEGRTIYRGIVRNAKDPQRLYNYSRSTGAELTSLAPKVPYLATAKMIGNYQSLWDVAHKKSFPFLPFDADPQMPGVMPQRSAPISQNTAITQEIMISDQELHDTTGLQQASLGQKSNEQSGRAIMARQREGDVANYPFYDNLGRAITYCGKVLLDLIPRIYDTERVVRLLKEDGEDAFVPVNQPVQVQQPDGKILERIFDLSIGKYDVVVSVGPSYSTQREEAAASMLDFINAVPAAGPILGDLLAKNFDWPGAQEISKRLQALLPPGVGDGNGQPPPPPPPDPEKVGKAQKTQAETEGILLDNRMKAQDVARKEMGFEEQPNEGSNQKRR